MFRRIHVAIIRDSSKHTQEFFSGTTIPIRNSSYHVIIIIIIIPIPVAVRSKAWVCGRSLSGIAGSNPTEDMDVCLL